MIIGADTNKVRNAETIKLIEYTYENFVLINIKEIINQKFEEWKKINQGRIYVKKGTKNSIELYLNEMDFENMLINKKDTDNINIKVYTVYYLEAPIKKDFLLGDINILINNENILTLNIYNKTEIKKKGIGNYLFEFIELLYNIRFI